MPDNPVSASLFEGTSFLLWNDVHQTDDSLMRVWPWRVWTMLALLLVWLCWNSWGRQRVKGCAEVSNVKDRLVTAIQLESLILAQNERWRQA